MTERFRFDVEPRQEFADRLEADLLRIIAASSTPSPEEPAEEHIMTITDNKPTGNASKWRTVVVSAAAALVLIAGIVWIAGDSSDDTSSTSGSTNTFNIRWAYSEAMEECPPAVGGAACLNRFAMPAAATFTGDIAGVGNQVVLWNAQSDYEGRAVDHIEHVATYNVEGEVAGCGSGAFMLIEIMQFVSGADHDRDSGTYTGTWQIVPESGRGELASLSGSGTSQGGFGTAPDAGREFTGSLTCS